MPARSSSASPSRDAIAFFSERFEREGDRARAEHEKAYMKSELAFRNVSNAAIRDVSRRRPELTEAFLRANADRCSGVTFREASKHLHERVRDELIALRE